MAKQNLKEYLQDPFLNTLFQEIRQAGAVKSILVDITHTCNIRCEGCYFFAEDMDKMKAPKDEHVFDDFISQEKARGTNFVTVTGGEPSLKLPRLKKLHDNFNTTVVTNGLRKIPVEGFEDLPIGLSVWGDHETDTRLRGGGKIEVFKKALKNYKDDPRVMLYYTTTPGNAHEIESVVEQGVQNGLPILFSYYGDISNKGGDIDHNRGFGEVRSNIDKMIEKYPHMIMTSSYLSKVISTGMLYNEKWGYENCCSVSVDNDKNAEKLKNGKPFNPHFNAYNPDLASTRRCCIGEERDCDNCYDLWAHYSWIMLNMRKHLGSKQEFTNWLTSMYSFYLINRLVDFEKGMTYVAEMNKRIGILTKKELVS
ncbi:radical SAM protein [Aquimarina pacifica]|uniref:radical SAM protein n=1 Tax=Aquimarina pacifica TaxID=1296415 RepID=UPI0004703E4D|nr:radical SAM protein [Aquimarina pacifica]